MANQMLTAQDRTVLGKQVKALRRAGKLPGIVYGPLMTQTVPVVVDRREFERFYQAVGHSTLFTLAWNGDRRQVFIREVQRDPVSQNPLHVDFFAPNLQAATRAMVPLVLHNPNPQAEGVLTELLTEIEVEARPEQIPHQLDADIAGLAAVGDSLRIADLTLPPGVTATGDPETVLVHLAAVRVERDDEADVVAEPTEPAAPAEAAAE